MRYVCSSVAAAYVAVAAFSMFTPAPMFGQAADQSSPARLSITSYKLVSERPITSTQSDQTYQADITNSGATVSGVVATLETLDPAHIRVVQGQSSLLFAAVPANGQAVSSNSFTILVDHTVPLDLTKLQWIYQGPLADAGLNETAPAGSKVVLNGSGSSNPSGVGTLNYRWEFSSIPAGSKSTLNDAFSAMPSFVLDLPGSYVVKLTVDNGTASSSSSVTVSSAKSPPVAQAGANQTVALGANVILDGTRSWDVDGNQLSYSWALILQPSGSTATLTGATSVWPSFTADQAGTYVAQLIVNDGTTDSNPASVTITTGGTAPVANAGLAQMVSVGALVQLNGAGASDVDGDSLSYQWSLISLPAGSMATLSSATDVNPSFTLDLAGTYIAQLIVNDGTFNSTPATVVITTNALIPPIANAGPDQTVTSGSAVTLSGAATDPQGLQTTLRWALIAKPAGSTATLSDVQNANPTLVTDLPGTYIAQLIANDGSLSSAPSTVAITTNNTPPVANAGPNQNVMLGATVTLDGTGSSDADHDPLTYSWSLLSRPNGSSVVLSAAHSSSPTFSPDVSGTFVAQLMVNDGSANSNPATVVITAATATTITLAPSPLNLTTKATGTLTVTLSVPAGPGGEVIYLSSTNTAVATVPATVTIPESATGANVTVVTSDLIGLSNVTASAPGFNSASATINVAPPSVSMTLQSNTLSLSGTMNGSLSLSTPAPAGGLIVTLLAVPSGIVTLPANVTIAAGATSATFTVKGTAPGSAVVHASTLPNLPDATAAVTVVSSGAVVLLSNTTVGLGQSGPFPVTLQVPAPAGGVVVTLVSSDTSKVTVSPTSLTIAAGQTSSNIIPTVAGAKFGSATIIGSAPGYTSDSQTVRVTATITFSAPTTTVTLLSPLDLTLNLATPAPDGGLTINLSSDDTTIATVPATVTFAAGAFSVNVRVTPVAIGTTTIHASAVPNVADTITSVVVAGAGAIQILSNDAVGQGQSLPFSVVLPTPAVGPTFVGLTSSDPTILAVTPSVYIGTGSHSPFPLPKVTGVSSGSATITASAVGFTSATQTMQVIVSVTFIPASLTIVGTATQNLTLNLPSPAPVAGLTVYLSSSDTTIATVPASVSFAAFTTSVIVPVTGVAPGLATIHASATGAPDRIANVAVVSSVPIILPSNVTVGLGRSVPFPVTLPSPAPSNGVTVTLASSDPSKVTVSPASVTIAAGQTTPATQPQVTAVNLGVANISASALGFLPASQPVTVTGSVGFSPSNLTIGTGATQNLTLSLSGPAPASGLTVALSSSNTAVATVPSTVSFPANATSVSVPVTSQLPGTAIIHANALPNIVDVTATVTVVTFGSITLPSSFTVGLGQSAPFAVTLSAPAPVDAVILLVSNDPSKVTISPASITIPAGQTTAPTQPQVTGINLGSTAISASASSYVSASQGVQVTGTVSFLPQTVAVASGATQDVTLTLSAPAPAGGVTVNLSSTNPGTASVPVAATFVAGATSATVTIMGTSAGSTTIHASALPDVPDATANVTVVPPPDMLLGSNVTVEPGQLAPISLTLMKPAPVGGVFVSLTSSDTSKVTVSPANVLILEGATTPPSSPMVTGITFGSSTITASAFGLNGDTKTVRVTATLSFFTNSATITGAVMQNLTLLLSSPAPAGGLTVNLNSSNTGVATVPSTVTFAANSTSALVPVTGVAVGTTTIHANALPNVADTTASVTVIAPGTINLPANVSVAPGQSANFPVTLGTAAPAGGVTVTLSSTDTSRVTVSPARVTISANRTTPATQPQVSGVNFGSATISASAPNYAPASQTVQVNATASFSPATLTITGTATQNLTLTLSAAAPASGFTVQLSSTNTGAATVPLSVNFAGNATTATVPVTGVAVGTTTIHASALPNIADTTASVTIVASGTITLPSRVTIGPSQSVAFSVTLGTPAPAGGVTVTLSSSDMTKVTISPTTVSIAAGQTTPATQPQVSGVNFGSANISASATGYTAASQAVQVTASATFSPTSLTIGGTVSQNLTLNLSAPAPAAGLTMNLSSSNTSVATVPASVSFAAGATSVSVPVTGVAAGTSTIHASALPNIADTTAGVTVNAIGPPPSGITVTSKSVGQNLEASLTITLPQAAPTGGATVTLTSSDPSRLLIAGHSGDTGTGSLTFTIAEGSTTVTGIYAQALSSAGTATVTASATNFTSGSGTITFSLSGFVLTGPSGIGLPSFSTNQGLSTTLTVSAARLDSSSNFAEVQPLRGGMAPVSVTVGSSSSSVGTISTSPLSFNGGDQSAITQFNAVNSGSTTVTASAPAGFNVPASGANTLTVTVNPAGLVPTSITVGQGLEAVTNMTLNGVAPGGGLTVSITSNDPSKLLFSKTPTDLGSASIDVLVPGGFGRTPDFYAYGLTSSGTATYNASAPGFGTVTGTVTLAPSGFVIQGPAPIGTASFLTTTGAPSTAINVWSALLDSSRNFVSTQAVSGGISINVNVSSSDNSKGTITSSPVTIAAGSVLATTQFQPAEPGSTTLSVGTPPGFFTPAQDGSIVANVITPGIGLPPAGTVFIGQNLQQQASFSLGQLAPAGGVNVTLTSNSPGQLLLSNTNTGAGSASITVNVPAGVNVGSFYLASLSNSGTATYTASAPGYASRTSSVTLTPSGAVIAPPLGLGTSFFLTTVATGASTFAVSMAQLNPDNSFAAVQQVAGGKSVNVTVNNTNGSTGSIGGSVVILGGADTVITSFTPLHTGMTNVSVVSPASNDTFIAVTVQ